MKQTKKGFYEILPYASVDRYLVEQIAKQSLVLAHHSKAFPIESKTKVAFVALGKQNDNSFLNALRQYAAVRQLSPHAADDISSSETLVVGIYADTATPWTKQYLSTDELVLLTKLLKHQNVHVVVFAKPYVLQQLSNVSRCSSVLLAHQQEPAFVKAAAQILFGKIDAMGELPVVLEAFD